MSEPRSLVVWLQWVWVKPGHRCLKCSLGDPVPSLKLAGGQWLRGGAGAGGRDRLRGREWKRFVGAQRAHVTLSGDSPVVPNLCSLRSCGQQHPPLPPLGTEFEEAVPAVEGLQVMGNGTGRCVSPTQAVVGTWEGVLRQQVHLPRPGTGTCGCTKLRGVARGPVSSSSFCDAGSWKRQLVLNLKIQQEWISLQQTSRT